MQQCMGAAERVLSVPHHQQPPNIYTLKRKSPGEAFEQPLKRSTIVSQVEPAQPPRNIQPRPISNGFAPVVSTSNSPNVPNTGMGTGTGTGTGTGKKRGRPSKADKEAQARANSFRTMEYAPITPAPAPPVAPLAPVSFAPQRDYASSPSYEIAGSTSDAKGRKRGKLGGIENSPTGAFYPLASPSSAKDIPRGVIESAEQPNQIHSPREYGGGHPATPRATSLHPPPRHPSPLPAQPLPQSLQQSNTLPPIQSGPRSSAESYRPEHLRVLDPIFPDRDRSRSAFDPISRATPPAPPPVANRG